MRTVDHDRRRRKTKSIVKAAARCFSKHGFHNSGMAEICAEAKVSPGAIYSYFASKNDIIIAVTEDYLGDVDVFIDQLKKSKDPVSLLVSAAKQELKGINYPLEAEIYAEAVRNPAVMDLLAEKDVLIRTELTALFQANGLGKPDAAVYADYVYLTFDGLRMYSILNSKSRHKTKLLKLYESTVRSLLNKNN